MASPYKLYGGATREDAISGLDPAFNQALLALYNEAPPEVQAELGLNSAYRDIETQRRLWEASDKSGTWVAEPGKSKHNMGTAADLYGFGLTRGKQVSDATKNWVTQNAARFGLGFPMEHEPWHIELQKIDAQMEAAGYTPEQRRNAIASIESAGSGDYGALGAWTGDPEEGRDRAYGRYQVMGSNIGPWAEQYLDQKGVTPEMFLADPKLQDELFDAVYGDYVRAHGERGAASKWFTGSEKEPERSDVHGKLTGRSYADEYMAALGEAPGAATGGMVTGATSPSPGYKAPTVVATAPNKDDKQDKYQKAASAALGGYADMKAPVLGAGGNAPQLPSQAPLPMDSMPIVSGAAGGSGRDDLALLMQRLNTQRLWG